MNAKALKTICRHVDGYPTVALVLQGGGALGGYHCGVYEGLHRAGIRSNWIAGISIGAINAAIIAGNAVEDRVDRLRAFWNLISEPASALSWTPTLVRSTVAAFPDDPYVLGWARKMSGLNATLIGQRGFFEPRMHSPLLFGDGSPQATSYYDTTPLRNTLKEFVDFDRINKDKSVRLTIGAAGLTRGNFRYFDSAKETLHVDHIMASAAIPPAFPAVKIDNEWYWDGGVVSNTPLEYILDCSIDNDVLVFQVDLWSARGKPPENMAQVQERMKDIRFSSRTRHGTRVVEDHQRLRSMIQELVKLVPDGKLPEHLQDRLAPYMDNHVFNIIHLIYQTKPHELENKDHAFGQIPLREHWHSGLRDIELTLRHPDYFVPPDRSVGVATHDVYRRAMRRRNQQTNPQTSLLSDQVRTAMGLNKP